MKNSKEGNNQCKETIFDCPSCWRKAMKVADLIKNRCESKRFDCPECWAKAIVTESLLGFSEGLCASERFDCPECWNKAAAIYDAKSFIDGRCITERFDCPECWDKAMATDKIKILSEKLGMEEDGGILVLPIKPSVAIIIRQKKVHKHFKKVVCVALKQVYPGLKPCVTIMDPDKS